MEPEQYKENQFDHFFSAFVDRINNLEIQLKDKEAEVIKETEKYMKEKAKFNVAMKEKETFFNLLVENLELSSLL